MFYNIIDVDANDFDFKQQRSLNHNLKLLKDYKKTSKLVSTKTLKKGTLLFKEGDPVKGIYFITEGIVKVFYDCCDKKKSVLKLASKGDIVGISSINSHFYMASAVVVKPIKAYFINQKNLKSILKENGKLNFILVNFLAMKLRFQEIRQKHLSLFSAEDRIIDALLLTAYKFGEKNSQGLELSIGAARKDIASLANTSTEKVIRTLSTLNKQKLIVKKGRRDLIIKDEKKLLDHLTKYFKLPEGLNENDYTYPILFY